MVVGIIGILAAIGIPAYQSYQDDAKRSVVESFLLTAGRTVDINRSLAKKTYTSDLDAKVQSKGTSVGAWATKPDPISEASGANWCIAVVTSSGPDGCLTSEGIKSFKGDLDCRDYETKQPPSPKPGDPLPPLKCELSGCDPGSADGEACSKSGGNIITANGTCSSATACS